MFNTDKNRQPCSHGVSAYLNGARLDYSHSVHDGVGGAAEIELREVEKIGLCIPRGDLDG